MEPDCRLGLFTCLIDMYFPAGETQGAVELLLSTVGRTEAKPGCEACSVSCDAADKNRVRYSETWNSETAFQRHVASEEFRRVLVALDLCAEEPGVVIGNLSERRGLSYLEELLERKETGVS